MTTNLGAEVFDSTGSAGFVDTPRSLSSDASSVLLVLRRTMQPALLNRIDEILVVSPLSLEWVHAIAVDRMREARDRVKERGYAITLTPQLIGLVERRGFNREYGARELLRTIGRTVLAPLTAMPPGAYAPMVEADELTWKLIPSTS